MSQADGHVGHLRTTRDGEALKRLMRARAITVSQCGRCASWAKLGLQKWATHF